MTVVYTTIFGDSDSLKPAPVGVEAVCFVESVVDHPDPRGWQLRSWPVPGDPRREAWRLRCIAHELFPEAERTIWIDASFTLTQVDRLLRDAGTADIAALRHHARSSCYEEAREIIAIGQAPKGAVKQQMATYQRADFRPAHLSISCILVRRNTPAVRRFNLTWEQEIAAHPGDNTQLSLDYAAWRQGLTIKALKGMRKSNPYAVHNHRDHRRRRKPYRLPEAVSV